MTRGLALTAALLLVGTVPALAQPHPPHPGQPRPHGPGHQRPDPTQHAALHALMHGSWKGTFRSPEGVAGGLGLSVAHDSLGQLTLKMSAARPVRAGGARNVLLDGATLRWTQDLSGQRCQATAVLTAATVQVPETLEGRMACEDGELTFTLRKAAE